MARIFRHEITGEEVFLDPAEAIAIQEALGADIIMAFDECIPYPCDKQYAAQSTRKTLRWAEAVPEGPDAQGPGAVRHRPGERLRGPARDVRQGDWSPWTSPATPSAASRVGEGLELLKKVVAMTAPFLPEDKPRYLMGVGLPEDILESVERGMDMFDCVIPTRYARSATLFTSRGRIRLTNKNYRRDFYPIDPNCACYACRNFTRAYLHHLFNANEVLSAILASIHNVHFYLNMMAEIRTAIEEDRFAEYKRSFLEGYMKGK